jgi:hypothetical protein
VPILTFWIQSGAEFFHADMNPSKGILDVFAKNLFGSVEDYREENQPLYMSSSIHTGYS